LPISNQRYLAFLSSRNDPSAGERDLQRLIQPRVGAEPSVMGLNFFNATDSELLCTLQLASSTSTVRAEPISWPDWAWRHRS